jgi:RNA polymerase sigma-70 factor (ECF subfamily)
VSDLVASRFTSLPLSKKTADRISVSARQLSGQIEASDEALLAKVSAGNRDSLALLFRRFARLVRNVGTRILRDKTEADDLVQEVFLYIHRKSALFDGTKGSARSWIVQVAYTQAFLRRRHLKAHGFYVSGIADKSPETELRPNAGAEYDHTVEGLFGRIGWQTVLEALTGEQRETLRLHFFEGYTFSEIAEKLGQSYANVRHHHYRGLEKLRKHLTEDELNWR